MTLDECRKQFEKDSNRSISMPLSGLVVWSAVTLTSLFVDIKLSIYIMLFTTGAIFPLAILVSKKRGELLTSSANPFSKLMGLCVLMVNLLWAIHIPLVFFSIEFVPLSVGIGLGLHWIVYSWIIQHPVGVIHAVVRTLLATLGWFIFSNNPVLGVGIAVIFAYFLSLYMMMRRSVIIT